MSVATHARAATAPLPPRARLVVVAPSVGRGGRQARRQARRDAAYALCLAALLTVGVLGVLLLNTSMQQQADRMARQRQALDRLAVQTQALQTAVDEAANPAALSARARRLRMHPVRRFRFVTAAGRTRGW